MRYLSIIFIVVLSFTVFGQTKTTKPKTTTPKEAATLSTETKEVKATQKVIVERTNGDKITGLFVSGDSESVTIEVSGTKIPMKLAEINNLRFGDETMVVNQPIPTAQTPNNSLSIEAAIIYQSGQVMPVARTTFLLLDDDFISILKNAAVQPTQMTSKTYSDYSKAIFTDMGFAERYGSLPEYQRFISSVAAALKPHIKYTFDTDFNGKAIITGIAPGIYYLFGSANTRQAGIVWHLPIDTATTNSVVLDNKNAAFAY